MNAHYITRARYHWRWAVKYQTACVACMCASLYAWPSRAGFVAFVVGCGFSGLAYRHRQRARTVYP